MGDLDERTTAFNRLLQNCIISLMLTTLPRLIAGCSKIQSFKCFVVVVLDVQHALALTVSCPPPGDDVKQAH